MIVDCHTHWGMSWEEKSGSDPAEWLEVLDRHGVDKALLMGHSNIVNLAGCRAGNDLVAEVAGRACGRLIGVGSAWPQTGTESLNEVRRSIEELGMKALKFHPWLQGFSTADPVFGDICALAGELNVPVMFHDGTPCYSLPEQIAGLARRFPETQFVLGHSGGVWCWRSALEAAKLPNIWLCLCGPHMRAIEIFCREAPVDRLLWGSDFGFGVADMIEYRLGVFEHAAVSSSVKEKILGESPVVYLEIFNHDGKDRFYAGDNS